MKTLRRLPKLNAQPKPEIADALRNECGDALRATHESPSCGSQPNLSTARWALKPLFAEDRS